MASSRFVFSLMAALLCAACALARPAVLDLRGGKRRDMPRRKKTMTINDVRAQNEGKNEYYAGGLDDQGGGSATVLLYPGENEDDEANSTNATCDAPEPPPKFAGTARSLKD